MQPNSSVSDASSSSSSSSWCRFLPLASTFLGGSGLAGTRLEWVGLGGAGLAGAVGLAGASCLAGAAGLGGHQSWVGLV
jgi:hypothetical protein